MAIQDLVSNPVNDAPIINDLVQDVVALSGIVVTPASVSVAVAATQQLTVKDSNGATVTAQSTFSSGAAGTATVSAGGLVTGVAAGTTSVTVTFKGLTTNVPVTVTA